MKTRAIVSLAALLGLAGCASTPTPPPNPDGSAPGRCRPPSR
ncbi:hypothetical protein ACLESD_35390 [Pyxidicoccus sp. 3LFB2]